MRLKEIVLHPDTGELSLVDYSWNAATVFAAFM